MYQQNLTNDRIKQEIPRRRERVERDRQHEFERCLQVLVRSNSASGFLRELEES